MLHINAKVEKTKQNLTPWAQQTAVQKDYSYMRNMKITRPDLGRMKKFGTISINTSCIALWCPMMILNQLRQFINYSSEWKYSWSW